MSTQQNPHPYSTIDWNTFARAAHSAYLIQGNNSGYHQTTKRTNAFHSAHTNGRHPKKNVLDHKHRLDVIQNDRPNGEISNRELIPLPIGPSVDHRAIAVNGGTMATVTHHFNVCLAKVLKEQNRLDFVQAIVKATNTYRERFGCPNLGISIVYALRYNKKRACHSWDEVNERCEQLNRTGCRPNDPNINLNYVGWVNNRRGLYVGMTVDDSALRWSEGVVLCSVGPNWLK